MNDIYKCIEEHNPIEKQKILITFDDIIVSILSNKRFNPIVTELFIRDKKLNIAKNIFMAKSYFSVPKNIRLNLVFYDKISKQKGTSTKCI